jgi:hypothetical protein
MISYAREALKNIGAGTPFTACGWNSHQDPRPAPA